MSNATAVLLMAMGWALGTVARQGLRMQRIREHNARVDAARRENAKRLAGNLAAYREKMAQEQAGGPVGRDR